MITPSFGLTATERVLPKLALDFTTASLDSRVTFTRAGVSATLTNSSGLIEQVAANTPRFDYDPVTLACKGLLIEEARTNIFQTNGDVNNSYWTKLRIGVNTGAVAGRRVGISADKIYETATSGTHEFYRGVTVTVSTTYTFSAVVKAAERNWCVVNLVNPSVSDNRTWFDLTNGVVGTNASGNTATITNVGGGFWRITVSRATTASQTSMNCSLGIATGNNTYTYTGDGSSGIYVDYQQQVEAGAFATSLIVVDGTFGGTARNADVATMTGTNFSDWFNASEGTFCTWNTHLGFSAVDRYILLASSNPATVATNAISTRTFSTTQANAMYAGGVLQASGNFGSTLANTLYKMATAYKDNNYGLSRNGSAVTLDTSCTVPTVAALYIGGQGTSSNVMCGYVQKIFYYPQRLTDAELQSISK